MKSTTIKLIGYNILHSFNEEYSINRFYDIITPGLEEAIYLLHVQSINHDGMPYDEWITLDLTLSNKFTAITELHTYILNSVNKSNKMNSDLISSITFEDGKSNFDEKVKDVCIAYYQYI